MEKIIFILVLVSSNSLSYYKCTDLQQDGTFTAYYSTQGFGKERKLNLLPEEVEELSEQATQIIQVEIA